MVRDRVANTVLSFLNEGRFDEGFNKTSIVLILKIDRPLSVSDLRPISLCNVVYKLMAKTLANRLKLVLSEIISFNQSAFIPSRLISNNIIIAYEALHSMRSRIKEGGVVWLLNWIYLKLVEWFSSTWIQKIILCVSTVQYSILVNGQSSYDFIPYSGLRQGDPLSSYLFLVYMEGLSSMLATVETRRV